MKRNVSITEISNGKMYTSSEKVRLFCDDCDGCSACCNDMGDSIVLDPFDMHQLTRGAGISFAELISKGIIEINVKDYVLLPNFKMQDDNNSCYYLNAEGKCSIHGFRPGYCRLFPLGRIYQGGKFKYFHMDKECQKQKHKMIRIADWIGYENTEEYECYVQIWHDLLKTVSDKADLLQNEQLQQIDIYIMQLFYEKEYGDDFFGEFRKRVENENLKSILDALKSMKR